MKIVHDKDILESKILLFVIKIKGNHNFEKKYNIGKKNINFFE